MTKESLLSPDERALHEKAQTIDAQEIHQLIGRLCEKDDKLRYQALLLLKHRSLLADDVYPYWETFRQKLTDDNSYQRSIGLMLIAANAGWADEDVMAATITDYLALLQDVKPITIRQCIQGLLKIIPYHEPLRMRIAEELMHMDLMPVKETMRKLVLLDMLEVLVCINREQQNHEIEHYIGLALYGGILDGKAKKQVQAMYIGQ